LELGKGSTIKKILIEFLCLTRTCPLPLLKSIISTLTVNNRGDFFPSPTVDLEMEHHIKPGKESIAEGQTVEKLRAHSVCLDEFKKARKCVTDQLNLHGSTTHTSHDQSSNIQSAITALKKNGLQAPEGFLNPFYQAGANLPKVPMYSWEGEDDEEEAMGSGEGDIPDN
jgi:hypothetical protein